MKKLWKKFFSPTPTHIRKWQRITGICGVLGTAIATGGAQYDFVPGWFVHLIGWGALAGIALLQFSCDKKNDTTK